MVEEFPSWLTELLGAMPPLRHAPSKAELARRLVADFGKSFVADGKHKHSLRAGSNLARLQPRTLAELRALPRLAAVMQTLGYSV